MILKLNSPCSLNMGEDLEFIDNFYKGKKVTSNFLNFRPLFKGVKTGKYYLLICTVRDYSFLGVELNFEDGFKIITPDHYKLKNYNYYKVDKNLPFVEEILTNWRKSDPLVHMGSYTHSKISKIKGYSYAYEYNGKFY